MQENGEQARRSRESRADIEPGTKEAVSALDRLMGVPELEPLQDELQHARELLAEGGSPDDLSPRVQRALRLVFGGYLDAEEHPEAGLEKLGQHDPAPGKPDDTGGLEATSKSTSAPRLSEMVRAVLDAPEANPGGDAVTLVFLSDPQVSRQQGKDDNNPRVQMLNNMNKVLNGIESQTWPTGMGLSPSVEGTVIGPVSGVFFGGDMCQTGGDYNWWDQANSTPAYYNGGFELESIRRLFDPRYDAKGLTKLRLGPVFFGLGNHDVSSKWHPPVGWFKDCVRWSTPEDYWRWQMWNFICQMHRGVFTSCVFNWSTDPAAGVPTVMDAKDPWSNTVFYWTERSLTYRVSFGPCDVYQQHVFGGDSEYGRASGFSWLKEQLAARGPARPVIIVQHYDFSPFSIPGWWTEAQRDDLLRALEPSNVIAFLMGHDHDRLSPIPLVQPYPGSTKVAHEFRPGGSCDTGNFAILRVSPTTFDIMQATGAGAQLTWYEGFSKTLPAEGARPAPSELMSS